MTLIQPNKNKSFLNKVIFLLLGLTLIFTVLFIINYNAKINLEKKIERANRELKDTQVQTAELKDGILNLFSTNNLKEFAAARNLVQDRNPAYLEISPEWSLAKHF